MTDVVPLPAEGNRDLLPVEAAKIYLGLGMELMPVHKLSKSPKSNAWQERPGVTDPAHANIMFGDPEQNIGFKPGELFVVIDIDTKHGGKGAESWAEVNERFGPLPKTAEFVSASGGGGLVYRLPSGAGLEMQSKMLGLSDLEFRTGAVNCILPPSRIRYEPGKLGPEAVTGQHRWKEGQAPGEIEIAELPAIVIEALRAYEPEAPAVSGGGAVAEYLSADIKAKLPTDARPAEFAPIREGCAFIKHADEHPSDLNDNEWYPVLSITSRCRDGENISHLISAGHPNYDRNETARKMVQANRASGPRSCANIKNKLGFKGCERCPFWGRIKSPINLGQLPPKPRDPRTKEVTAYRLLKQVKLQSTMIHDGETDRVFRPATGELLKAKTFAAMFRDVVGRNVIDTLLGWTCTPRAAHFDYLPGDTRLMIATGGELPWCNNWLPGGVAAREDAKLAERIMRHFVVLFPDELTRKQVLDYIAHLLEKPHVKIMSTLIITGPEGCGKSTLWPILEKLFGSRNARKIGGRQLSSRFKESLVNCQLIVVEEANHGERFEVTEELKQWFTDEVFDVEGKQIAFYTGRTPRGIIMYSNHEAPLVVGPGSRRFFIGATTRAKPSAEYFKEIYAALDDETVVSAFKHMLLERDISSFNPYAEPPRTGAREAAEEASRTPLGSILAQMIEEENGVFYRDVILSREAEEAVRVPQMAGMLGHVTKNKVTAALKQVGAQKVGMDPDGKHRQITMPDGSKPRLWAVRNLDRWLNASDDELKAEATRLPPLPDLSNVRPMKPTAGKDQPGEIKAG